MLNSAESSCILHYLWQLKKTSSETKKKHQNNLRFFLFMFNIAQCLFNISVYLVLRGDSLGGTNDSTANLSHLFNAWQASQAVASGFSFLLGMDIGKQVACLQVL